MAADLTCVELPGAAAFLPQLARRAVKKGVEDNFAILKTILETVGSLTDHHEARKMQ